MEDQILVPIKILQNKDLSLKAKGLLVSMMACPPKTKFSLSGLSLICKEGRKSIGNIILELIRIGYITRTKIKTESMQFKGYQYSIKKRF